MGQGISHSGATAFKDAVEQGRVDEIASAVCRNPAIIKACLDGGNTAWHVAASSGQVASLQAISRALHTAGVSTGYTSAQKSDTMGSISKLINAHNGAGMTPLMLACEQGHLDAAMWLLVKGADPWAGAAKLVGWTPLHFAVRNKHPHIAEALVEYVEAVPELAGQQAGVKFVNVRTHAGTTTLHIAAWNGDASTVRFLVLRGADIVAPGDFNFREAGAVCIFMKATALHLAALNGRGTVVREIMKAYAQQVAAYDVAPGDAPPPVDPRVIRDARGGLPFHAARLNRHYDILLMLHPMTPLSSIRDGDSASDRLLGPPTLLNIVAPIGQKLLLEQLQQLEARIAEQRLPLQEGSVEAAGGLLHTCASMSSIYNVLSEENQALSAGTLQRMCSTDAATIASASGDAAGLPVPSAFEDGDEGDAMSPERHAMLRALVSSLDFGVMDDLLEGVVEGDFEGHSSLQSSTEAASAADVAAVPTLAPVSEEGAGLGATPSGQADRTDAAGSSLPSPFASHQPFPCISPTLPSSCIVEDGGVQNRAQQGGRRRGPIVRARSAISLRHHWDSTPNVAAGPSNATAGLSHNGGSTSMFQSHHHNSDDDLISHSYSHISHMGVCPEHSSLSAVDETSPFSDHQRRKNLSSRSLVQTRSWRHSSGSGGSVLQQQQAGSSPRWGLLRPQRSRNLLLQSTLSEHPAASDVDEMLSGHAVELARMHSLMHGVPPALHGEELNVGSSTLSRKDLLSPSDLACHLRAGQGSLSSFEVMLSSINDISLRLMEGCKATADGNNGPPQAEEALMARSSCDAFLSSARLSVAASLEDLDAMCGVCFDSSPDFVVLQRCKHRLCVGCARELVNLACLKPALCAFCRGVILGFELPKR